MWFMRLKTVYAKRQFFVFSTCPFLSRWKLLAKQNLPHEILRWITKVTIFLFHSLNYFKGVRSKEDISLTSYFRKINASLVQHAGMSPIIEFSAMAKSYWGVGICVCMCVYLCTCVWGGVLGRSKDFFFGEQQ